MRASQYSICQLTAGLAVNSSVTVDALNTAVGSEATAIDSRSGGAVLVSSDRLTQDVDDRMLILAGMPLCNVHACPILCHAAYSWVEQLCVLNAQSVLSRSSQELT